MEVSLGFSIWEYEDITDDELTMRLGIVPTRVHRKGMKIRPNAPTLARHNGWILQSPSYAANANASFEDQRESLFIILEEKKELLRPMGEKYVCEVSCGIYIDRNNDTTTPATFFDQYHIDLMSYIRASLDFDMILIGGD